MFLLLNQKMLELNNANIFKNPHCCRHFGLLPSPHYNNGFQDGKLWLFCIFISLFIVNANFVVFAICIRVANVSGVL